MWVRQDSARIIMIDALFLVKAHFFLWNRYNDYMHVGLASARRRQGRARKSLWGKLVIFSFQCFDAVHSTAD